jgi:hypothetical protein
VALHDWFDTWGINVDECGQLFIHIFPSNIYGVEIGTFDSYFSFNNFMLLIGSKLVEALYVNRKP